MASRNLLKGAIKGALDWQAMNPHVRAEAPEDHAAVDALVEAAFGRGDEAKLVAALRASGLPLLSLVAEEENRVIGHILFSPVTLEPEQAGRRTVALGPMAVHPERQTQGVGSLLVRAGLEACRARGESAAFVLGHPAYYPRFGFEPAAQYGVHFRSFSYDPAFFALELTLGALRGGGWVRYPAAFEAL